MVREASREGESRRTSRYAGRVGVRRPCPAGRPYRTNRKVTAGSISLPETTRASPKRAKVRVGSRSRRVCGGSDRKES